MSIIEQISAESARLECSLRPDQTEQLGRFISLLARWSRRIRLTGSADPTELVGRQLADSLVLAAVLPRADGIAVRCVDVGSGGGLPGIPCALLRPDLSLALVEANARKCAFLRTAAFELGVDCEVIQSRVELLASPAYQLAWSRATFAPPEWLRCAERLVEPGGLVGVFTAKGLSDSTAGFERERERHYTLADGTPRALSLLRRKAGC